ncbi:hypothetical protein B14911_05826 [Bacillus sp. NRRL B-14911]|nr:hypothetical protein B14911_05826 [Bacillus sp. NRRL B-14911]
MQIRIAPLSGGAIAVFGHFNLTKFLKLKVMNFAENMIVCN